MKEEISKEEYKNICIDVATISTTMERVLDHHKDFKARFDFVDSKLEMLTKFINSESKEINKEIKLVENTINERISKILFKILFSAALGSAGFISGIIIWLVQNHKN